MNLDGHILVTKKDILSGEAALDDCAVMKSFSFMDWGGERHLGIIGHEWMHLLLRGLKRKAGASGLEEFNKALLEHFKVQKNIWLHVKEIYENLNKNVPEDRREFWLAEECLVRVFEEIIADLPVAPGKDKIFATAKNIQFLQNIFAKYRVDMNLGDINIADIGLVVEKKSIQSHQAQTVEAFNDAWNRGKNTEISSKHKAVLEDPVMGPDFRTPEVKLVPEKIMDQLAKGHKVFRDGNRVLVVDSHWENLSEEEKLDVLMHEAMADWMENVRPDLDAEDIAIDMEGLKVDEKARRDAHKGLKVDRAMKGIEDGVDMDFAAQEIPSRVSGILRKHLERIYREDSLMNTFNTMEYWEDVFKRANALDLIAQAEPLIKELVGSALEKYNSGNWQTGKDLIKPMIDRLNTFTESHTTNIPVQTEKSSVTTRGTVQPVAEAKVALRTIITNIISQKQSTNGAFLPFIRIENGLITGLIYDRRAVRAFENTLTSLGLNPSLGEEVALEFENAIESYSGTIVVDDAKSVDMFLSYLSKRYGAEKHT